MSSTGIVGLTLGGGEGWLMGRYGMTVDNLLAVELVTAEGGVLLVSEQHNPDLFWALRGGGGNFGVATAFEYRAHPVDTVVGGMVLHPLDRAADVWSFYRDFTAEASDALTVFSGQRMPIMRVLVGWSERPVEGPPVVRADRKEWWCEGFVRSAGLVVGCGGAVRRSARRRRVSGHVGRGAGDGVHRRRFRPVVRLGAGAALAPAVGVGGVAVGPGVLRRL